jgi:hypothetical protein
MNIAVLFGGVASNHGIMGVELKATATVETQWKLEFVRKGREPDCSSVDLHHPNAIHPFIHPLRPNQSIQPTTNKYEDTVPSVSLPPHTLIFNTQPYGERRQRCVVHPRQDRMTDGGWTSWWGGNIPTLPYPPIPYPHLMEPLLPRGSIANPVWLKVSWGRTWLGRPEIRKRGT